LDSKARTAESIGQGERREIIRAKVQIKNIWDKESSPILHNGQEFSEASERRTEFNRSLVGRIFQAIFQGKSLNRSFIFNFQRVLQNKEEVPSKKGIKGLDS
jgi:hypothetical protein